MKYWIYSLGLVFMSLGSCSSQKKLVAEAPFSVNAPSCQTWVGGRPESGSGMMLTLPVEMGSATNLDFSEVYFRGQVTKASFETSKGKTIATCKYNKSNTNKTEMPFELKPNEAVIGYTENGSKAVKYIKVTGVKEKLPLVYPSKAQN